MIVKLVKFQHHPKEEPVGFKIGMNITLDNFRSFYKEQFIDFQDCDGLSDQEIIKIVWDRMQEDIDVKVADLQSRSIYLMKNIEVETVQELGGKGQPNTTKRVLKFESKNVSSVEETPEVIGK